MIGHVRTCYVKLNQFRLGYFMLGKVRTVSAKLRMVRSGYIMLFQVWPGYAVCVM
jgi:hypothetical protein